MLLEKGHLKGFKQARFIRTKRNKLICIYSTLIRSPIFQQSLLAHLIIFQNVRVF